MDGSSYYPNATRYFWTLNQAVDLIFDCMENATTSHFHFPSMKSMSMGDLLDAMAENSKAAIQQNAI